jgi:hypothetical protein
MAKALTNEQLREALIQAGVSTQDMAETVRDRVRLARDLEEARVKMRDKFAMAALTGVLSGDDAWAAHHPDTAAKNCYALADAMMKQREVK